MLFLRSERHDLRKNSVLLCLVQDFSEGLNDLPPLTTCCKHSISFVLTPVSETKEICASLMSRQSSSKQRLFYEGTFRMCAKLSIEAGSSDPSFNRVLNVVERGIQLEQAMRRQCERAFAEAREGGESLTILARHFYAEFKKQPHSLISVISCMLRLTAQGGTIPVPYDEHIRSVAREFHFPKEGYERLRANFVEGEVSTERIAQVIDSNKPLSATAALGVLGCSTGSSKNEIRRAYRQLVLFYHPDTYNSLPLSADEQRTLAGRFHRIQAAYEKLKGLYGIK